MPPISESIYVIHFPHILFFMSAPGGHKTQKYALYSIAPYISIIQSVSLKFKWHSCGKIQKNAAIRGSTTAFFYILINSLGVLKILKVSLLHPAAYLSVTVRPWLKYRGMGRNHCIQGIFQLFIFLFPPQAASLRRTAGRRSAQLRSHYP